MGKIKNVRRIKRPNLCSLSVCLGIMSEISQALVSKIVLLHREAF